MKKLTQVMGMDLEWSQPSGFKQNYELHAGTELIATLRFRSSFGSFATAETADGSWTFKRVGFFMTHVTVRLPDSGENLAIFREKTWKGGGTLEFADGCRLLASTNFWQSRYAFETETGGQLVVFEVGGVFRHSAKVKIDASALRRAELPLLVTLGWYLAILMQQDSAAVAATTAT